MTKAEEYADQFAYDFRITHFDGTFDDCGKFTKSRIEETFNEGSKLYLKSILSIIRNIDNKEQREKDILALSNLLAENGEQELAEYCAAQIGFGTWVVDDK